MVKKKKDVDVDEAIMNLLIVLLLKENTDMELITRATGLDDKTIYKRFPAALFKQGGDDKRQRNKK